MYTFAYIHMKSWDYIN